MDNVSRWSTYYFHCLLLVSFYIFQPTLIIEFRSELYAFMHSSKTCFWFWFSILHNVMRIWKFYIYHSSSSWPFYLYYDVLLLDKLTPAAFEKHSGRETAKKWKNNIWVIVDGEKVPLYKTVLLKYYNQVSRGANGSNKHQNGHRDEFVRCTSCNKERRFRLRTKEECRIHHDAVADANWKCSDLPYDKYVYYLLICYHEETKWWICVHDVCL